MIGVYDKNIPSGLNDFYLDAIKNGVELYHSDNLDYLRGLDKVIINPPCIMFENKWRKIGEYINKNPNIKILFFAPNNTPEQIKKFIGVPKNIEYVAISDGGSPKVNWDKIYSLIGGKIRK